MSTCEIELEILGRVVYDMWDVRSRRRSRFCLNPNPNPNLIPWRVPFVPLIIFRRRRRPKWETIVSGEFITSNWGASLSLVVRFSQRNFGSEQSKQPHVSRYRTSVESRQHRWEWDWDVPEWDDDATHTHNSYVQIKNRFLVSFPVDFTILDLAIDRQTHSWTCSNVSHTCRLLCSVAAHSRSPHSSVWCGDGNRFPNAFS